MSTVFLLGAGASYGSGDCSPYCPPLGPDLFDDLQRWGGVAATVDLSVRDLFRANFEVGMEHFYRNRSIDTTTFLREMAGYFAQFEPGPDNQYIKLAKIVAGASGSVVLATTNYELLIEMAINMAGHPFAYTKLAYYPRGGIPVLKIHGSCNFLPEQKDQMQGLVFDMNLQGVDLPIEEMTSAIYDGSVRPATPQETRRFCRTNDSMAPALGMYLRGKHVLWCPSFVERQQQEWRRVVERAGRIYVIGAAVYDHDTHIWDALASARGQLRYVDPYPSRFLEWCESRGRKNASVIAGSFEEALPIIRRQMRQR
jgi:hypothetical protein